MRILLQRVSQASCTVDNVVVGAINQGLLAFVGIHQDDTEADLPWYVQKLINLRIFSDENGKMNLSLKEVGGELLIISQFTLYGNCTNGRRPDFFASAPPAKAIPLYEKLIAELKKEIAMVETGIFGADMKISLINDGPVTLMLEKVS